MNKNSKSKQEMLKESKFTEIAVVSNELEIPKIETQPQPISWIKGKPLTETIVKSALPKATRK